MIELLGASSGNKEVELQRSSRWMVYLGFIGFILTVLLIIPYFSEPVTSFASGTIRVDPQLSKQVEGISVVFISVFAKDSPTPMPVGALRLKRSAGQEVLSFNLLENQMTFMQPKELLAGGMRIKVRFDRNGRAGPDQPGDLVGRSSVVTPGAKNVSIVIDQMVGEGRVVAAR